MKPFRHALSCILLASTAVAFTAGCGTSPPSRFLTLASDTAALQTTGEASAFSIVVGPVSVPELVDRPQLVLRTAPTSVDLVEQARWAAPLKSEIPRVIASHLARLVPRAHVTTSTQRSTVTPSCRVLVDIQRFDSALNESAVIEASWTVHFRDGTSIGGRSVATQPAGAGYDELVAAHSRALAAISRDIAAVITPAVK